MFAALEESFNTQQLAVASSLSIRDHLRDAQFDRFTKVLQDCYKTVYIKTKIVCLVVYIYETHIECHDILMLGKCPIK